MTIFFAWTLFFSASLLFLVQPMFAKIVLPMLGGTPSVWNACMVFYQAALLGGYVYAHLAIKWLGLRRQSILHLGLFLLSLLLLPIGIPAGLTPPTDTNPIPWLFMLLLLSVGFPFFMTSATAPMLQKWFAHTGHPAGKDPYFLYGASNFGSLIALIGYPILIEPSWRLAHQTRVWTFGYILLMLLILGCAVLLWRSPMQTSKEMNHSKSLSSTTDIDGSLTVGQRMRWLLLSFCPSSLLLGVTSHITTDVVAIPLFWVIPLAIYLLTFVLVFARKPLLGHDRMVWLQPFLILPLIVLFWTFGSAWILSPLHLLAFFVSAMVCHGELVKSRPAATHLTEFYLYISVGGVLGGIFNALLAPTLFKTVAEYPLALVLACLLRPNILTGKSRPYSSWLDLGLPFAMGALIAAMVLVLRSQANSFDDMIIAMGKMVIPGLAAVFCYSFRYRPVRFGLGVGAIILMSTLVTDQEGYVLHRERSFFGVLQIKREKITGKGEFNKLIHGTTLHGVQSLDPALRQEPLSYFHRNGPIGQVFSVLPSKNDTGRIAVVGLGAGTMACYAKPGQHWTFYEIDPLIERIARNPQYFTYLEDCPVKVEVVLGDARLSLAKAPHQHYDLIAIDAFNSDTIPVHLITQEAIHLYLAKLAESGILVFHISNKFLDLKPVLGNLGKEAGLVGFFRDMPVKEAEAKAEKHPSTWAVMARHQTDMHKLAMDYSWEPLRGGLGVGIWTDDFSNILSVIKWKPRSIVKK